jgi:hypothetical protein
MLTIRSPRPKLPKVTRDAVKRLSRAGQDRFWTLVATYAISDDGGLLLAVDAMATLDIAERGESQLRTEGLTVVGRDGQVKAHPLCSVVRDARSSHRLALKQLNLSTGNAEADKKGR